MTFQRRRDFSAYGKGVGWELFSGCQEVVLDLHKAQSSNHLILLICGDCFNLCYELSARGDALRPKVSAPLALPHTWEGQHLLEAAA